MAHRNSCQCNTVDGRSVICLKGIGGYDGVVVRRVEVGIKGDGAPLIGCEVYGHDIIGKRGDGLLPITHAVGNISRERPGRVERQFSVIVAILCDARMGDEHVSKSLIGHTLIGLRHDMTVQNAFCLNISALPDELLGLGYPWRSALGEVVVRAAGPYRFFIQSYALCGRPAKDHGPQPSVAQGQSIRPHLGRFGIP